MRCKESHSACYFSDWHFAVPYPREYVEHLEEQQEQLSIALLRMRRLLKEANVQTIPALPETEQAQDLLVPLREAKVDHRSIQELQQIGAPFGMGAVAYKIEAFGISPIVNEIPQATISSSEVLKLSTAVSPFRITHNPAASTNPGRIMHQWFIEWRRSITGRW
ncbi:uncharacterized protein RCC_00534 [Ramularia collo-cygni]|uniref:Uncharacterized protein n=1 Tax=Ramularia collo-cygni TaxID=112498 RepID=A0A2D3USE6_9PEZI|nr:uncharacterized protein RCC_00534 [Ramularia collo-cygni]CZT14557.1 uncharacterized protein RCC_00534 [Ramularia collo-cygni]